MALAMLVMGFLQILSETGQRLALIRLPAVERAHYDTAWTIGVLFGVVIAVAMLALAPLAARYFDAPRLEALIFVLAARPLIAGFENIGTVDYRRDLRFDLELKLLVLPKLMSFGVTVALAYWWRDYWALAAGLVFGQLSSLVVGYAIHPYRPRFGLSRIGELWDMSYWSLIGAIGRYLGEKSDELVVGRRFETQELGVYSVVGSTAMMPVDELVAPPARALYSGFSRLHGDPEKLRQTYLDSIAVLYTVAIASSIGVAALAHDIVLVLLGAQWMPGIPLVPFLAFAAATGGIATTDNAILIAAGRPRIVAIRTWAFAVLLVGSMFAVPKALGLEGIAMARLGSAAVLTVVTQWIVVRHLQICVARLLERIWRPAVAGIAMHMTLAQAIGMLGTNPILRLFAGVALGGAVFVAIQMALWASSGRPRGIESFAIEVAERGLSKFSKRTRRR
ncbi:MAG: oligosaccharide flippase family protein [Alphaproteobacteria bacterium]|nr:oligosaccharide flippase family protein [Alphaproteobacteria bacterium]